MVLPPWCAALGRALVLALAPATAFALDPGKGPDDLVRQHLRATDGLPHDSVEAITQTEDGYLWLGTAVGLARYNGASVTAYTDINGDAPQPGRVLALAAGEGGALWIGGMAGLIRFEREARASIRASDGLAHDIVPAVHRDADGTIWAGTAGGLTRLRGGGFSSYGRAEGLDARWVLAVRRTRDGVLWVGTQGGLYRMEGERFVPVPGAGPRAAVRALLETSDGALWAGGERGLARVEPGRAYVEAPAGPPVQALLEDRDGNLWVASPAGLLRRRDGAILDFSAALPDREVLALHEDQEGTLWVGTRAGGVTGLGDRSLRLIGVEHGVPARPVRSVAQAPDGAWWFGTEGGGLGRVVEGRAEPAGELEGHAIQAVLPGPDGAVWVGTDRGLFVWRAGALQPVRGLEGARPPSVRALAFGADGALWAGDESGAIFRVHAGMVEKLVLPGPPVGRGVRAILPDPRGPLWIASAESGLFRLAEGRFTRLAKADGLAHDWVRALAFTSDGALWIGTTGGGITRLKDGRLATIDARAGLFSDHVQHIVEDDDGRVWFSTHKGLFRVPRDALDAVADGRQRRLESIAYTTSGRRSLLPSGNSQPCGGKGHDGTLWFAAHQGLVIVDPRRLRENRRPPPVHIERVVLDGRLLSAGAASAPPGPGALEVSFAALSFVEPGMVRYRYKLEGLDAAWIDAGARNAAYYTRLPPGSYLFRVEGANNEGVWSRAGATFAFSLAPRFHQTRWFLVLAGALLLSLGGAAYLLRVRQLEARFRAIATERTRVARDLHDTLLQGLAATALQVDTLQAKWADAPAPARRHLQLARAMLAETLDEARSFVLDLRPQPSGDADLRLALESVARRLTAGLAVEVSLAAEGSPVSLSPAVLGHLVRIGQEAVANAVKHAAPTRIAILLRYGASQVVLRVTDDGRGFDPATAFAPGHVGLLGLRERAREVGGELTIDSAPGRGTVVAIAVPAGPRGSGASESRR